MEAISFQTSDGWHLNGQLLKHENPERITLIHAATGVPSGYYKSFAKWLSRQNRTHVVIYDYRDSTLENFAKLKKSQVKMSDWGIQDQSAALDYALKEFPGLEPHTIGHSLGGMCLSHHKNAQHVVSHIAVNAGPAYWKNHPWHYTLQVILFWFLLGPVATKIFGFMPGKLIGLNANLPKEVYWQWRRWCVNTKFFEIDWGQVIEKPDLSTVCCDVRLIATKDDVMIPPDCVKALSKYFPCAEITYHEIDPKISNLKQIGHIGIFSRKNAAVWPQIIG